MLLSKEQVSAQKNFVRVFPEDNFSIQGHRGCRGLFPENTIAGFIEAVKLGVRTIKLDVVVSADHKLVVSHEPWMSSEICLTPDGDTIDKTIESIFYNLYKMNYDEIRQFDCGSKLHPRFPHQKKMKTEKPLLDEVISRVEKFVLWNKYQSVNYSIELKSSPDGDNYYHPEPELFVAKVIDSIQRKNISRRTIIQSADTRILQVVNDADPAIRTSLLVENEKDLQWNLHQLNFVPSIYSPDQINVNQEMIIEAHALGIKVIPWTVNDSSDMQRLFRLGVDGLITDYPDRAFLVFPFLRKNVTG